MDQAPTRSDNRARQVVALAAKVEPRRWIVVGLVVALSGAMAGAYSLSPIFANGQGNPECDELSFLVKYEWREGGYAVDQPEGSGGEGVVVTGDAQSFDWTSSTAVDRIIVKGGSEDNRIYLLDEATSGIGLLGPLNTNSPPAEDTFEISNITFCYDDEPTLTVIKTVINDDGGSAVAGDFTIDVEAPGDPDPFPGNATGTVLTLGVGDYSVTEPAPPGYEVSYSQDCTGTLAAGEDKVCTVTNDDIAPELTVIKNVVNDDGGDAVAADFTINVSATGASPASLPGSEAGTKVSLEPGAFTVTEVEVEGYAVSYDGCDGVIGLGESKTCTITNDDIGTGLTVVKNVINDDGGDAVAADFTINVSGNSPEPGSFSGSEAGQDVAIGLGAYQVTETEVAGYAATYSEDCSGTLEPAGSKVCTITNDDIAPELTVVKTVVNDDGGDSDAGDFTLNVANAAPFAGSEAGTVVPLIAGEYEVTEDPAVGYLATYSEDCSGTIGIGESKTCTITNDDIAGLVTVIKNVINDDGGVLTAEDFSIEVDAAGANPASFGGTEQGVQVSVPAGGYEVIETEVAGYAAAYSEDCSGTIGTGESKTCTITNDDIAPSLTVIKNVVNSNGGGLTPEDFTLSVEQGEIVAETFDGSPDGVNVTLKAGSYNVTESAVGGYAATFSEGCSGVLEVGDTATCTVTNVDLPPGLTVIKNVVNDNGGTAVAGDFEISVSTTGADPAPFAGSSAGTLLQINAGAYEVSESALAGYAGTFSQDCSGTIAPGEAKACTITNDDIAPVITVVKNVVNDDGGTRTADSFTMFVVSGTSLEFAGNTEGTQVAVNAGPYAVGERDQGLYVQSLSDGCVGSIAIGETAACTVTNDDPAPAAVEVAGVAFDSPQQTQTVEVLGVQLPRTGFNVAVGMFAAALLLATGLILVWVDRRTKGAQN